MDSRIQRTALAAPLFGAFLAIGLGDALAGAWALEPISCGLSLVAALGLVACALRVRRGVYVAAMLSLASLGALRGARDRQLLPLASPCADPSSWRVRVSGESSRTTDALSGDLIRVARVELVAARCGEVWEPAAGAVLLRLGAGPAIARDDLLELSLRIDGVAARRNPTEPDPFLLARRDGVSGRAQALSPYAFVGRGDGLLAAIDRARDRTSARFEARLGADRAAVAKALSLGDQGAVSPDMRRAWADSGLAHLLSISGLHVTLIAAVLYFLARQLLAFAPGAAERYSLRRAAAIAALPGVLLFCLFAGAPAPAVRATIMACAFLVGVIMARRHAVINALGLAGSLILLAKPASLYDAGFLLSFVAVFVLLLVPSAPAAASRWRKIVRGARGLVVASVAVTLVTLPITAFYFSRVSLVGPFTNLIGVPLGSAVATPLALLTAVADAFSPPLATLFAWPFDLCLGALNGLTAFAASLPFAAVSLFRPNAVEILLFYALLAAVFLGRGRRRRQLASLAVIGLAVAFGVRSFDRFAGGRLTLLHPYVGQGDATIVLLPQGGVMLVDAGGSHIAGASDPGERVVAQLLRQLGIHTLDLVILTHPHPDHLEGFGAIAEQFRIRELWWNGEGESLPTSVKVRERVTREGGAVRLAAELPAVSRREGVRIELLHPRPPPAEGTSTFAELATNDNSIVLRLSFGARSALLPGDIESEAEARIASSLAPVDYLKVPHHGSPTSSSATLLAAARPHFAVFSVGEHNHFGFPHPEVLGRYERAGVRVLRTDQDGLVRFSTDSETWEVTTERGTRLRMEPSQ